MLLERFLEAVASYAVTEDILYVLGGGAEAEGTPPQYPF